MTNKQLLTKLKAALRKHSIEVSVQPAVTTDSLYLRLDRGVLGSLRIGNHHGRPKYHYTYEIGRHIPSYLEIKREYLGGEFSQHKFPEDRLPQLVQQILIERANLRSKYSTEKYSEFVHKSVR